MDLAKEDKVNSCKYIQEGYVYLKDNLILNTRLKDMLLTCCEIPDEKKVCYDEVNSMQCGELLKLIIRKGQTPCSHFLLAMENQHFGFYRNLQRWRQSLDSENLLISFPYELKDHRSLFLEELEPSKTADYLFQFGVFDIDTHDEIEAVKERMQRTQLVLHHLERKFPDCMHTFVRVLQISNQGYIISEILKRRNEKSLSPQDECLICVRYNYRLIRNRLQFELTWDHLRQDGVIREQIPQEDNSQRGKLVKEAIRFGPRGCESLLRCLEMQQKETYKYALDVWKKRKTFDVRKERNITVLNSDLDRFGHFLVSELEPLELSDILFEEGVLTVTDHDKIEGQQSLKRRNEVLLDCLKRCPPEKLDYFAFALKQSEKESILERMKKGESDEAPTIVPEVALKVDSRNPHFWGRSLPDDELTMLIQENDNPNSKINTVVSTVTNNLDVKIEVVRMAHMAIKDATSGSIIIHLCPLTDTAIKRFFTADGKIVQTMLEKLLVSAGMRDLLQKKEEFEISVKISKKDPSHDDKVNRSQNTHDIMRRKMRENEIHLVDELEPSQLASYLAHKNQLSPEESQEIEHRGGRIQKSKILLDKIRTSANPQLLDLFKEFLEFVGRKDLLDLVQASSKDEEIHHKAEKIKKILLPNYTNVVEEIETSIIKDTLQRFVEIHDIKEEFISFLPEIGKSRHDRVHRFLTFVFKNDEYVIELEKVFKQNSLGHLLEDKGREDEFVSAEREDEFVSTEREDAFDSAGTTMEKSSSLTLNEGVLFDCTYRIVLSNEKG